MMRFSLTRWQPLPGIIGPGTRHGGKILKGCVSEQGGLDIQLGREGSHGMRPSILMASDTRQSESRLKSEIVADGFISQTCRRVSLGNSGVFWK
jgi:hypothetical protein